MLTLAVAFGTRGQRDIEFLYLAAMFFDLLIIAIIFG